MADELRQVPLEWLESKMDKLFDVYNKIKNFYWVKWQGGLTWKFGKQPGPDWQRPTLDQVIEHQAMYEGVHKTMRIDPDHVRRTVK